MCPTCHHPIPYAKRQRGTRYCSRACFLHRPRVPKAWQTHDAGDLMRVLNSGKPLECIAAEWEISRAHLYQCMHEARIVRVGRRGQYAVVHWKNQRQLSLF